MTFKDFLYGLALKQIKLWTRAGLIQATEFELQSLLPESRVLSIGGYGATDTQLDIICSKLNLQLITLDIDDNHMPDILADIGSSQIFQQSDFSAVVALEVFEHIQDYERALENIHKMLVPGGLVIVSTPWIIPVHDKPADFRRYTHFELARIFGKWFTTEVGYRGGYTQSVLVLGLRGLMTGGASGKFICVLSLCVSFFCKKPKMIFTELDKIPDSTIGYFVRGIKTS